MINNDFYDDLGERWYTATDDPVALLRAESRLRTPWVLDQIAKHGKDPQKILDIGCGGGFLANPLSKAGHEVTGIDQSDESLEVAKRYDETGRVKYLKMDAHHLNFENESLDVVCAMDFLEHISDYDRIFSEVSRVLKKDGLFLFHTFNRNFLSYLVVIKGVEWFVKNTPPKMHVLHMFIKPEELRKSCSKNGLQVTEIIGVQPKIFSAPFWRMIFTGKISSDFEFQYIRSPITGYSGVAKKQIAN